MKMLQILGTGCPKCRKLAENAEAETEGMATEVEAQTEGTAAEVEAETEHEATMIARDIDGGDFIPKSGVVEGDWQIDGAEEIKL
mgnify:CR=1 FL=1